MHGKFDLGDCADNCNSILQHVAAEVFSNARAFEVVVGYVTPTGFFSVFCPHRIFRF